MRNRKSVSTWVLIALCLILGCQKKDQQDQPLNKKEEKEVQVVKEVKAHKVKKPLCFKNEYPYQDDSLKKDVEEMNLFIEGEDITGAYNWLPAEKDQRKGSLTGTIKDHVIDARYTFMQEGKKDTVDLKIYLDSDIAIITGGDPSLGLGTKIKKIDCE